MDEKMLKKLGIVIGGFAAFIFLLFIFSSCTNRKYTYEKLEEKMMSVARNYYKNNEKELPSQDKDTKTYTLKKMISDGYIDELSELFDDENIKCSGDVTVINNNGYYMYAPNLTCGKDYQTTYLKDKIIENSLVDGEEAKVGLHEQGDQYIFKGEVKDNYLLFNGIKYRILRINEDGSIRVFQTEGIKSIMWDNRYSDITNHSYGINEYVNNGIDSRLKESITKYYNDENVWSDSIKGYIPTQTLCIGKRSKQDITKDGSTECSVKLEGQPFGALAVYEILQASLDESCSYTTDAACRNYNWITSLTTGYWTITADVEKTDYAFYTASGRIGSTICKTKTYLNVVFNISDKAVYKSGTGTEEDPYEIQVVEEKK